jgi:hypothetical protein
MSKLDLMYIQRELMIANPGSITLVFKGVFFVEFFRTHRGMLSVTSILLVKTGMIFFTIRIVIFS